MKSFKKYLSQTPPEETLFWCVVLTFLLLPTGTAPPLIAIGLACVVWIFSGQFMTGLSIVKQPWFRPVILFLILPWIGLTYSKNMDLGMDYAMKTKYWIAVFITAGCYLSEKRFFILVCAFWGGLSAGAILALFQFAGFVKPVNVFYLGFGIVHTLISMYLLIGILMAAFYFRRETGLWAKAGFLVLIFLFLFHLTVLEGRSGYLIFALLSPLVAWDLTHRFSLKIKALACVALVFSLCLSPVVRNRVADSFTKLNENRDKIMTGEDIKEMPRPFITRQTLDAMKKHPIIGIGTGSLPEFTRPKGSAVNHPHNNFLYMGVSFGIAGIIAFFWLFWNMLSRSWRSRENPLGYFVFSTGLVLFLGGMFDTQILNTGTLLMLAMSYGFLAHLDPMKKGRV
ncbi:MAG: O-antigen ligase family protein [Proteobacteria bacterium]|nr:O-antigen ligase family protein [Desulfobacula sp.]MBU3951126.1 O-antigen ligase family protein [Pseudomonadota bacterium]MBU4130188.1 O-antigen ligase family protein [Pseudomonadota bacterium]